MTDLIETFYVVKGNNKIKQGKYILTLKKEIIQDGNYNMGIKTGVWRYYNYRNLEFIYDYDKNCILTDSIGEARNALFSESYIYFGYLVGKNLNYPNEARDSGKSGQVSISIVIDSNGKPKSFEVAVGCGNQSLNNEALRVVTKVSNEYPWYPGIYEKGEKIDSRYEFRINFEVF